VLVVDALIEQNLRGRNHHPASTCSWLVDPKEAFALDLGTGKILARRDLSAEAYTAMLAPDESVLYVTVWGAAKLAVLRPKTLEPVAEISHEP